MSDAIRAGAHEPVEVRFTVNGTPAELHLPPRHTLADALRDHLGLTGTHLGCEHGVCGMCTVLVDGQAARACLLFACQLHGCEVTTVEGLGRPDELHPLQESFGRHHALQCGFCTPGFLLSSYDLLAHRPDVAEQDLPEELSGVLCRCTGYRNILTAVADTARAHPDGIPEPGNCAPRALVGRASGRTSGSETDLEPGPERTEDAPIVLPDTEPAATVEITSTVDVASRAVWNVFDDVPLLARCLPGADLTEDLGDGRYAGRAQVSAGPVKLSFTGRAHILGHDRERGVLRVVAQGQDTGGARTQAEITLRTRDVPAGTELTAEAAVHLSGRIAQFGRALAGDISRRMFEQFADNVRRAATSERGPSARRPGALRLLVGSVIDGLRRRFR
ncbi:MAG: 2Fe-2S iron-sulfur cluster-binding protein [Saccharopolyspora rectivirgula]